MKKIILSLIVGFFVLNMNAQTSKTEPIKISNDSLIANVNVINDTKYEVVSFSVSAVINGYEQEAISTSGELTAKQKNIIKSVAKGDKVYFTNIDAKPINGKAKKLKSVVYIIE